jgi:hypothetical protein
VKWRNVPSFEPHLQHREERVELLQSRWGDIELMEEIKLDQSVSGVQCGCNTILA